MSEAEADVCLLIEGAYPYVAGGVSSWVQSLIKAQSDLTFHIVALVPDRKKREKRYEYPDNVVGESHVYLQDPPAGAARLSGVEKLFADMQDPLLALQQTADLGDLKRVIETITPHRDRLGQRVLLDSEAAFDAICSMYEQTQPEGSFLHYFWTWRTLMGGLFSILLSDMPRARVYHAISTGYAGLLAARAKVETGRPLMLTEHGIYTNERRIEILMADWLFDLTSSGLSIEKRKTDLRDLWVQVFRNYARLCYGACDEIITLYEGNQRLQLRDDAPTERLRIIPNGVDYERYVSQVERTPTGRPTVGLLGRVVPIKDVKTFIRACGILRERVPDLLAYVMGPTDEDEVYFDECEQLVRHAGLEETVIFTGRINIMEYLGKLDAIALTSISEAQPLVILEAGAAGIPSVATDVGSCSELLYGRSDEDPPLGPAGAVTPVSSPRDTADALGVLLTDPQRREACGRAIQERVRRYYNKVDIDRTYGDLYRSLAGRKDDETLMLEAV